MTAILPAGQKNKPARIPPPASTSAATSTAATTRFGIMARHHAKPDAAEASS
ncbi:hypothetical protein ACHL6L_36235 [Amycolatopsis sp. A24]|uniref:hypothetical protein n=1 Tax=Amycolatopsis sp. A24 TaxID=3375097 RepID=UPI0039ED6968